MTTILLKMLKCYLWLTLCLQFALINAARTRRGSLSNSGILKARDAQEHVHIKVHIADVGPRPPRTRPPAAQRLNSNQHESNLSPHQRHNNNNNNKKVLPTVAIQQSDSSKELPYEFDFFGLGVGEEDNSLLTTADMLHNSKYGPVVFTSNIQNGAVQQPMSQQFMRQLFSPEMMSVLKTETDENSLGNNYRLMTEEPATAMDVDDMMQEYFEKFNQPRAQKLTANNDKGNWSPKLTHTRKKYGSTGIGEAYPKETLQQQFYNTILKQQRKPAAAATISSRARKSALLQQRHQRVQERHQRQQQKQQQKQKKQQQLQQYSQPLYQSFEAFQQAFEDDASTSSSSDEFEAASDDASSTSASTEEDMTAAFNKLKPISYHDMYGEYATPITTATATGLASSTATNTNAHHRQQQQQQGFNLYQETIPSYTSTYTMPYTTNDWLQQQHTDKQQQQQIHYKPNHQQQQKLSTKKHKPKSQQTQFVLQPSTLRLPTSPSSSLSLSSSLSPTSAAAASSSLLSTSPISSGFGSGGSSSTSTWSIPYDFVQQSYQQQLAAQQQPHHQHQQQQQLQQKPHQDYKLTLHKKHKNRTKRKRNRIIVE